MVPIAIDVGIGETLEAINGILTRHEHERDTVWDSLACQLEAVSLTVGDLDHMYFALLAEIEDVIAQGNLSGEQLASVISQGKIYCMDGRLTLRLAEWRGVIQSAAYNPYLKQRRYRSLASTLRSIDDPLKRYIERLYLLQGNANEVPEYTQALETGQVPGSAIDDQRWDLRAVLELLDFVSAKVAKHEQHCLTRADPMDACEEAIRNYNRALSLTLAQLIGHARQDLAMEHL